MDLLIRKLDAADVTENFDCGDPPMNEYLHRYAKKNQGHLYGVTYVCISPDIKEIIGFYTIANTTIPRVGIPADLLRGLSKYQDIPAILLGRLGVDRRAQGRKIGELLISHCLEICLHMTTICGARYVVTDAYLSAVAFYKKYGFREIQGSASPGTAKMFLDLKIVRSTVAPPRKPGSVN